MPRKVELDLTKPMIKATADGISWKTYNLFYVLVDHPDAHKIRAGGKIESSCIEMCPWSTDGHYQIRERVDYKESMTFWQLKQEVHDWIVAFGATYMIDRRWDGEEFGWKVGFIDKRAAAAFKLAWGGMGHRYVNLFGTEK